MVNRKQMGLAAAALLALLPLSGCKPKDQVAELETFDGQRAFKAVEALVQISPRDAGTANGKKAADLIFSRLKKLGIHSEIVTFTDDTPDGPKTMHNVIGRIPGKTDRWLIVGSHFDTMPGIPGFQGANDSGSSTGVVLELARIFSGSKPRTGLIFAFFDGEEGIAHYIPGDGLHGSRHFAKQLVEQGEHKQMDGMILLDMVGDRDLQFVLPANSSQPLAKQLLKAAHTTGYRERFSISSSSIITDDHVPFMQAGIPALDIIDFKYGSAPGKNDYWHTSQDNLQHISAESLGLTGSVVREMIKTMIF
ncbi:MAG: Zn-dependent exopeptidase M28 [Pontiellaceae bacterium]|nr:Zn-dependent exopeptidase M28 [Pontiellaceae bacterium]MBN2784220.1 Zn-dependent exopeptidase M28 [Pontiellaceae bacterium]